MAVAPSSNSCAAVGVNDSLFSRAEEVEAGEVVEAGGGIAVARMNRGCPCVIGYAAEATTQSVKRDRRTAFIDLSFFNPEEMMTTKK